MAVEPEAGPAPTRRVSKVSGVAAPEFSLAASIGGVRGVIESVLPYTVFSFVYAFTKDLQTSIIASLVPVVVLVIWRLIARETLSQAISGALVIALGAFFAQRTGSAVNFFLPNILKNAGFAIGYTVSILVRWPLIGVVVGPVTGEMFAWRHDRARLSAYQLATWLWVGLFVVRLAVQIPLYLAENVTLLGTLNGTVLVGIIRGDRPIAPTRDDSLEAHDELMFITVPESEDLLQVLLTPGEKKP